MITRRGLLGAFAAPAIIKTTGLLMPIKAWAEPPKLYPYQQEMLDHILSMDKLAPGTYNVSLDDCSILPNGRLGMTYRVIGGDLHGATVIRTAPLDTSRVSDFLGPHHVLQKRHGSDWSMISSKSIKHEALNTCSPQPRKP